MTRVDRMIVNSVFPLNLYPLCLRCAPRCSTLLSGVLKIVRPRSPCPLQWYNKGGHVIITMKCLLLYYILLNSYIRFQHQLRFPFILEAPFQNWFYYHRPICNCLFAFFHVPLVASSCCTQGASDHCVRNRSKHVGQNARHFWRRLHWSELSCSQPAGSFTRQPWISERCFSDSNHTQLFYSFFKTTRHLNMPERVDSKHVCTKFIQVKKTNLSSMPHSQEKFSEL